MRRWLWLTPAETWILQQWVEWVVDICPFSVGCYAGAETSRPWIGSVQSCIMTSSNFHHIYRVRGQESVGLTWMIAFFFAPPPQRMAFSNLVEGAAGWSHFRRVCHSSGTMTVLFGDFSLVFLIPRLDQKRINSPVHARCRRLQFLSPQTRLRLLIPNHLKSAFNHS